MADNHEYAPFAPAPWNERDWDYFQFMYRGGEVVVVRTPSATQHVFQVHSGGNLTPARFGLRVQASPQSTQGHFALAINGTSSVRMRKGRDGICRGTTEHYSGTWTQLSKTALQMAAQGLNIPAQAMPMVNDPMGVHQHPSGLPDNELEDCLACAASYGACVECLNTGRVPKTQQRSKPMNTAEMIAVIQVQQGAKIVACQYAANNHNGPTSGGIYHFKNVAALPLEKDDLVVVQTGKGFSLATVFNPDVRANACECPLGDLKHVVTKVDLTALNAVLEGENSAMHALALSEVTERMNKYKEQLGAETFNSMAGLLAPPAKTE